MPSQILATLTKICLHLAGCQILVWYSSHLAELDWNHGHQYSDQNLLVLNVHFASAMARLSETSFKANCWRSVHSSNHINQSVKYAVQHVSRAGAFSSENFWLLTTVAFSFVFDKNCPIMDYLGLKDSSRQLQANCAISYSFYLHLMLHACAARFDVTRNLENFWFLVGI